MMLEYWYMFPVGMLIATIAMMSGIGGAALFSPFFLIILKLEPITAIAIGLFIEIFGFASGVIAYLKEQVINFTIVKKLIPLTLPATIVGAAFGRYISPILLKAFLVVLLLSLSFSIMKKVKRCEPKHPHYSGIAKHTKRIIIDTPLKISSFIGGMSVGMVSIGLGEMNEYNFLKRLKLPTPVASGTSVFLVAASAIVGVGMHAALIIQNNELSIFREVFPILLFTVPGVIIGARLGVKAAGHINHQPMEKFVSGLFLFLGLMIIFSFF
ncbi:MAG: sulfite exporter TauE/SafE family protein [Nanoarchaeota archaeon]